ncbi:MAG: PKD domain-containing protein [Flavobacteriales bacterium]
MEQSITIVALALSIAGISYLKVEQLDRMAMAQEAAAAQAVQDSIATAEAAVALRDAGADAVIEAAKVRFVVIHDSEPGTNEVDLVLDGSASRDTESDSLAFYWEQLEGSSIELANTDSGSTTFTARPGEYTFRLTVTDTYGASSSEQTTVAIMPEPNSPPTPEIQVFEQQ